MRWSSVRTFLLATLLISSSEVHLTESASVLQILFPFMYRRPHPKVKKLEFSVLLALAEAAEKYEVFPAMQVCQLIMARYVEQHPLQLLDYAGKHGCAKLAAITASNTAGFEAEKVQESLTRTKPWQRGVCQAIGPNAGEQGVRF